jgi:Flp pilus assembly protein TadG
MIAMPRMSWRARHSQAGAVALEFALLFLIFFAVFYAMVSYSLVILVKHGLAQAAAEGARASVRLDPINFTSTLTYQSAVRALATAQAQKTIEALPKAAQDAFAAHGTLTVSFTPSTKLVVTGGTPLTIQINTITVTATYADYDKFPLLPVLKWYDSGGAAQPLPPLPQNLIGKASLQLQL